MINKLTDEQIARFPEFVKKWVNIGLCTDPIDKEFAVQGVYEAYGSAKLGKPMVIFVQSPIQLAFCKYVYENISNSINQVRYQVGDQVWDQVGAQVGA